MEDEGRRGRGSSPEPFGGGEQEEEKEEEEEAEERLPVAWPPRYLVFSSPSAGINLYIGIKKRIY